MLKIKAGTGDWGFFQDFLFFVKLRLGKYEGLS